MDFDPFRWNVLPNAVGPDLATPIPDFGITILEENDQFLIRKNPSGEIVKILKNVPPPAMPQWLR